MSLHSGLCEASSDPRYTTTCYKCGRPLPHPVEEEQVEPEFSEENFNTVCWNVAQIMGWNTYAPWKQQHAHRIHEMAKLMPAVRSHSVEASERFQQKMESFITNLKVSR